MSSQTLLGLMGVAVRASNGTDVEAVAHESSHESGIESSLMFVIMCVLIGALVKSYLSSVHVPDAMKPPYTLMLFLIGFALGTVAHFDNFISHGLAAAERTDPHLILFLLLPPLLYESAAGIKFHVLWRVKEQVVLLASIGVIISLLLTTGIFSLIFVQYSDWRISHVLLLSSILCATDPVAVVAALKELGAPATLSTLIEGESLLNDGSAFVLFLLFKDMAGGATPEFFPVIGQFLQLVLGGIVLGIFMSVVVFFWLKIIYNHPLIEIPVILVGVYATFFLAEAILHVSGVLATVMFGFMMSNRFKYTLSPAVMEMNEAVWIQLAHIAETIIFVMGGIIVHDRSVNQSFASDIRHWLWLLLLYIVINIVRACMVGMLEPILAKMGYGFTIKQACVVTYGGLRGAVSLVLGLLVESDDNINQDVRQLVNFHVSGIVFLTLIINGWSTPFIYDKLRLYPPDRFQRAILRKTVEYLEEYAAHEWADLKTEWYYADADWEKVKAIVPDFRNLQMSKTSPAFSMHPPSIAKVYLHYSPGDSLMAASRADFVPMSTSDEDEGLSPGPYGPDGPYDPYDRHEPSMDSDDEPDSDSGGSGGDKSSSRRSSRNPSPRRRPTRLPSGYNSRTGPSPRLAAPGVNDIREQAAPGRTGSGLYSPLAADMVSSRAGTINPQRGRGSVNQRDAIMGDVIDGAVHMQDSNGMEEIHHEQQEEAGGGDDGNDRTTGSYDSVVPHVPYTSGGGGGGGSRDGGDYPYSGYSSYGYGGPYSSYSYSQYSYPNQEWNPMVGGRGVRGVKFAPGVRSPSEYSVGGGRVVGSPNEMARTMSTREIKEDRIKVKHSSVTISTHSLRFREGTIGGRGIMATEMSNQERAKYEAQLYHTYFNATRSHYEHQFEEGIIGDSAVHKLLEAVDRASECRDMRGSNAHFSLIHPAIEEWKFIKRTLTVPKWLELILRVPFGWIVGHFMLYNFVWNRLETLHGYVRAHEYITPHFPPDIAAEFSEVMLVARSECRDFTRRYKDIVTVVETMMASRILLQYKREKISELGFAGAFTARDTEQLLHIIDQQVDNLVGFHPWPHHVSKKGLSDAVDAMGGHNPLAPRAPRSNSFLPAPGVDASTPATVHVSSANSSSDQEPSDANSVGSSKKLRAMPSLDLNRSSGTFVQGIMYSSGMPGDTGGGGSRPGSPTHSRISSGLLEPNVVDLPDYSDVERYVDPNDEPYSDASSSPIASEPSEPSDTPVLSQPAPPPLTILTPPTPHSNGATFPSSVPSVSSSISSSDVDISSD